MKRWILAATLITAVCLAPVAIRVGDITALSLAGLIPFVVDLKNGQLE